MCKRYHHVPLTYRQLGGKRVYLYTLNNYQLDHFASQLTICNNVYMKYILIFKKKDRVLTIKLYIHGDQKLFCSAFIGASIGLICLGPWHSSIGRSGIDMFLKATADVVLRSEGKSSRNRPVNKCSENTFWFLCVSICILLLFTDVPV